MILAHAAPYNYVVNVKVVFYIGLPRSCLLRNWLYLNAHKVNSSKIASKMGMSNARKKPQCMGSPRHRTDQTILHKWRMWLHAGRSTMFVTWAELYHCPNLLCSTEVLCAGSSQHAHWATSCRFQEKIFGVPTRIKKKHLTRAIKQWKVLQHTTAPGAKPGSSCVSLYSTKNSLLVFYEKRKKGVARNCISFWPPGWLQATVVTLSLLQ